MTHTSQRSKYMNRLKIDASIIPPGEGVIDGGPRGRLAHRWGTKSCPWCKVRRILPAGGTWYGIKPVAWRLCL